MSNNKTTQQYFANNATIMPRIKVTNAVTYMFSYQKKTTHAFYCMLSNEMIVTVGNDCLIPLQTPAADSVRYSLLQQATSITVVSDTPQLMQT